MAGVGRQACAPSSSCHAPSRAAVSQANPQVRSELGHRGDSRDISSDVRWLQVPSRGPDHYLAGALVDVRV